MKRTFVVFAVLCVSLFWIEAASAQMIHACVKKNNGQMRVVEGPEECSNPEYHLFWPTFPVAPTQEVWVNDRITDIPADWTEVRALDFDKASDDTGVLVEYDENVLVGVPYPENGVDLRILIDGEECVDPGPMDKEFAYTHGNDFWYLWITDNIFTRALCTRTAAGPIAAGQHRISVTVRKTFECPYYVCGVHLSSTLESDDNADAVARLSVEEMALAQ